MLTQRGLRKRRLRYGLEVVLVLLAVGFPTSIFAASDSALLPAERFILEQVVAGHEAALKSDTSPKTDGVVNAEFLRRLLTKDFPGVKVTGFGVRISGAIVRGQLDLTNEEIPYFVALDDCVFEDDLILVGVLLKRTWRLNGSQLNGVTHFYGAKIEGNLEAIKVHFNKAAEFELMEVHGHAFFNQAVFLGPTRFYRTKVSENFEAHGTHFADPQSEANFEGLSATSALFQSAEQITQFDGPVRFYRANIANNFEANDAVFNGTANFQIMHVTGHLSISGAVFNRLAEFTSTAVGGTFEAGGATFKARVTFIDLKADALGFNGTKVTNRTEVSGLTFREVTPDDFNAMIRRAKYDAGAYSQLEEYYLKQGNSDQANQVYIEQRRRERGNLWPGLRWLWNVFLDGAIGYGRHPERVLIWSGIVMGVGCYVFRSRRVMDPQKLEYKRRRYSRFLYSLDLFLPIVDLQFANIWMPKQERRAARRYLPVHVIAGWILVTILVGAVTGILK